MKGKIVIGLLWGDEGKGISTDYLYEQAEGERKIVVRFSGGQQAGHNVCKGDLKHIHSSFGAGTLAGAPTYLTEHTAMYPIAMYREYKVLKEKGINPSIFINPKANVSTPYDIEYNRITERIKRHGSCGMGVAATMKRNIETGYKLYAVDLTNVDVYKAKLVNIEEYYFNLLRTQGFSIEEIAEYHNNCVSEMIYFHNAVDKIPFFIKGYDYLKGFNDIIFEGSQGVLLDMDHGFFPNVTYANTTSKNAIEVCDKIGCKDIEIYYITRCYQTRHGNGWMSNNDKVELINTEEEINVDNEWQNNLRIGEIDYDLINYAIKVDSIYSDNVRDYRKALVVTCLDQRPGFKVDYDKIKYGDGYSFDKIYESYSPDSKDFKTKWPYS